MGCVAAVVAQVVSVPGVHRADSWQKRGKSAVRGRGLPVVRVYQSVEWATGFGSSDLGGSSTGELTSRNQECRTPSISSVRFSIQKPRRRNSKMRALY